MKVFKIHFFYAEYSIFLGQCSKINRDLREFSWHSHIFVDLINGLFTWIIWIPLFFLQSSFLCFRFRWHSINNKRTLGYDDDVMVIHSCFLGPKWNLFKEQLDKFLQLKWLIWVDETLSSILLNLGYSHVGQTSDYQM